MEGLLLALATWLLLSCPVKGIGWWWQRNDTTQSQEKFPPSSSKHPVFWCPDMSPSPHVPVSVELVKPADIKVIAALGDSLTTALGANATSAFSMIVEFRHASWSIGGYGTFQEVITLANILKLFNPNLIGASPGKTIHRRRADLSKTGFNLAVTGHNTYNLPLQTRELIDTMRAHGGLNFEEDWKLLTILIGMNDICDYCKDKEKFSADNFIHYIIISLEMLMNEVPRMIVNFVQIMPMVPLREVQRPTPGCLLKRTFCSCLIEPESTSPELQEIISINMEYQRRLEELLNGDRFFRQDFAVVLQPFLKHTDAPRLPNGNVDMSFFSRDCFHFTLKTHEEMAKGLWNNMFEPVWEKTILNEINEPIRLICPSLEHPYIYTRPASARSRPNPPPRHCEGSALTGLLLLLLLQVVLTHIQLL